MLGSTSFGVNKMARMASAGCCTLFFVAFLVGCQSAPQTSPGKPAKDPIREIAANGSSDWVVECAGSRVTLDRLLQPIVTQMVSQKIPYSQDPANEWRDCSGNFLRLSSYLAQRCPDQESNLVATQGVRDYRSQGSNRVRAKAAARTTRQIARWYDKQDRFTPIYYDDAASLGAAPADLRRNRDQVRPGTVLFFSKGRPLAEQGKKPLFSPGKATAIVHMATVTKVQLDSQSGQVIGFEMYHGRNAQHPGMVTKAHFWDWPNHLTQNGAKQYPPFGNWSQRLVGIATLLPSL